MLAKGESRRSFIFSGLSSIASILCFPDSAVSWGQTGADQVMEKAGFTRYKPKQTLHPVYKAGQGPAVLVLHELPGLYHEDISLASHIAKCGFTAFLPLFFGNPDPVGHGHSIRNFITQCVVPVSQFHCWIPHVTSSVSKWLLPLIPGMHSECGGKGVGVIGMCLTGSVPLALLKVDEVKAAVLCQPTNPFLWKGALDISEADFRVAADRKDLMVLALKFSSDKFESGEALQDSSQETCRPLQRVNCE